MAMGNSKGIVKRLEIETIDAAKIPISYYIKRGDFMNDDINYNESIERWTPIKYPNNIKPNYMVSDKGNIKNIKTGKLLKPFLSKTTGYLYVSLPTYTTYEDGETVFMKYSVHRLVLCNFTNEIDKIDDKRYVVNHIDANKLKNWYSNLEFTTYSGNAIHAKEHGLIKSGEDTGYSKVSNETVHKICQMLQDGEEYKDIARQLNLPWDDYTKSLLVRIRTKVQWKDISDLYDFDTKSRLRKHDDDLVRKICECLEKHYSTTEIHKLYGHDVPFQRFRKLVWNIKNRNTYTDISKYYNW